MIILITGTPGSGKSLYAVGALLNGQFKDRPKFVNGIPDLLLPHTPISDEDVQKWYEGGEKNPDTGLPAFKILNAVICVDEVQRIARPRSASVPAPEWIKRLEVHRHSGCDFIFITQHPQQIDAHIRRLVGRHIHVRRTWALKAAVVYEWDNCSNLSNLKQAQSKLWRYPKGIFDLYKSSELHTKAGGRVPFVVWIVLAAVIAFPFVGWNATSRLLTKFTGGGDAQVMPASVQAARDGKPPFQQGRAAGGSVAPMTQQEYVAQFTPRVEGLMHTAPAYDGLTAVKVVPLPSACIESSRPAWTKKHGGSCGCYTQTGTPYETTQAMCVQFVRNGVFLPFVEPVDTRPARQAAAPAAAPPAAVPSPGNPTFSVGAVMPAPDTKSTVSRDAEVMAFMSKRRQVQ